MDASGYIMDGEVEAKKDSYVTGHISLIRSISKEFARRYGAFHYAIIKVTKNGKKVGYGLFYWKDKERVLVTMNDIQKIRKT